MHKKNPKSKILPITMIILIIVLFAIVVFAVVMRNMYLDKTFARQEFEQLAREYYEEEMYPSLKDGQNGKSKEETLGSGQGFIIRLRQVLNHGILYKNVDYRIDFINKHFECNTNNSTVRIFPKAPYGKTDYDFELTLNCADL